MRHKGDRIRTDENGKNKNMISIDKLKVFEKYRGDIDGVVRTRDKIGLEMSSSGEWATIDDVAQRWIKVKNGVASETFKSEAQKILDDKFEKAASEYLIRKMKL